MQPTIHSQSFLKSLPASWPLLALAMAAQLKQSVQASEWISPQTERRATVTRRRAKRPMRWSVSGQKMPLEGM